MTKITPNEKKLLIERLAPEQLKSSMIVIPESAQRRSQMFKVIAVGGGIDVVGAGDTVLLGQYAGTEIEVGGRTLMFIHIDEVLGVIAK